MTDEITELREQLARARASGDAEARGRILARIGELAREALGVFAATDCCLWCEGTGFIPVSRILCRVCGGTGLATRDVRRQP